MGRHKLRAPCIVCKRVMLPWGRSICSRCLSTLPGLPRFDRDDDEPTKRVRPRPAAKPEVLR
jgi:hypothetical protein